MFKNLFLLSLLISNFSFAVPPYRKEIVFDSKEWCVSSPGYVKPAYEMKVDYDRSYAKTSKFDYELNRLSGDYQKIDKLFLFFYQNSFLFFYFVNEIKDHLVLNYSIEQLENLNINASRKPFLKAVRVFYEKKEATGKDFFSSAFLVLSLLFEEYYKNNNDPFFKSILMQINLSEDYFPRLPHIVYCDHLDYMQSQILRFSFSDYELKLQELSDEAALKLSKSDEEYLKLKEENRRFVEKMKKERELLPKSESVLDERNPLGCAAGFDMQAPAAAAGGRTGASFDDNLLKELKAMEEKADSKVSGYAKLQPRKAEVIKFYSFLLPKQYNADKADQFFSHFKIETKKFYDMIEDVLEKDAKAKKKKAKKIEARIEDFFGQSVFNKGAARHYKITLVNKEYDLYLHKDHAGSQGWQTSASYALIYFLNSLKEDFEAATSAS